MRSLLRVIAIVLLFIFVLTFPVSLLMRNVGQLIFNPETISSVIEEQFLDPGDLSETFRGLTESLLRNQTGEQSEYSGLAEKGIDALDTQDWEAITSLIAPSDLILETSDAVVTGLVTWLDNDEAFPNISIELLPWKKNIVAQGDQIVTIVLNALPDCSLEELGSQILDGLSGSEGLSAAIPACKPNEPIFSAVVERSGQFINTITEQMPTQINLSQLPLEGFEELALVKEILRQARLILSWSWVISLGLGILALIFAVNSLESFLRWAGWPAFFAGVGTLFLAVSFGFFSTDLLPQIAINFFQGAPVFVAQLLQTLLMGLGNSLAPMLYLQAGIMILLGLGFLIAKRIRAN